MLPSFRRRFVFARGKLKWEEGGRGLKRHMALGDFLVAYLRKIGVDHIFGIPGDLTLKLFFALGRQHGIRIITLSHEPGVGFAADGYARATGKIGVACVTYGAGGHNMVNPVAGSFSERVPILVFSGGPGEEERKLGTLIHHQAREIESQHRIFQEVTCASRVLTDPRRAAHELHEVVNAIWAEQRPGYVEIHRDMVDRQIEVHENPTGPTATPGYATRTDYHSGASVPLVLDGKVIAMIAVQDMLP